MIFCMWEKKKCIVIRCAKSVCKDNNIFNNKELSLTTSLLFNKSETLNARVAYLKINT